MTSDPNRRHVWIHKLWEQKGIMILNSWDQNTPTQLHKQETNVQGQERPQVCLKINYDQAYKTSACRCCYFRTYKVHAWSYPNVEMTLDYKFNKGAVQVNTPRSTIIKKWFSGTWHIESWIRRCCNSKQNEKMVLKLGTWWHLCKKRAHRIDHPSPTNTFFLLRGWDNITSDIYRQCCLKRVEQESAGQERKKNKSQVIAHSENHSSCLRTQLYVEYEKYDLK